MFCTLGITSQLYAQNETFRINQAFSGVQKVDVQGGVCNVVVLGGDRIDAMVSGFINSSVGQKGVAKITAEVKGDVLVVSLLGGNVSGITGEIRVLVPVNTSLNVQTQSGNIEISGMKGIMFDVAAESGNVNAMDLTGKCRLNSMSGKVSATRIVGNVTTSSMTSSVEITNIHGIARLSSGSGAIVAGNVVGAVFVKAGSASTKLAAVKGNVEVRTASGSSDISDLEGNLDITTASGSILLNKLTGYVDCETASGDIKATNVTLVKGAEVSTLSGKLSFQVLNVNSDLSYDLTTVSGKVSAKGVSDGQSITSGTGPIMIKGSTVSGNLVIE